MGSLSDSLHCTPRGAFRRLSYQSGLQAHGRDPGHHQLHRHPWTPWSMMPTLVFLQPGLPSSAALVTQFSCVSRDRTCTDFHRNQVVPAFAPVRRFLLAHLLVNSGPPGHHGLEHRGLLDRSRISPWPRPCTEHAAFTALGANEQMSFNWRSKDVGADNPLAHCAPTITSGFGRVGGPPMYTSGCTSEDRRPGQGAIAALCHLAVLALRDAQHPRASVEIAPPSLHAIAARGYCVVACFAF